jgi:hypothetical protein
VCQLLGKVGAAENDGEEESQRRGLLRALFDRANWKRRTSLVAVARKRPRNLAKASTCRPRVLSLRVFGRRPGACRTTSMSHHPKP